MERPEGVHAAILGISQLVYLTAMATLGVRLLIRAHRTRQLPEGLLASHFLLCCSVGYLLMVVGLTAAQTPGTLSAAWITGLIGVGTLASCIGVWTGAAFNYMVFRRGERWAQALLAVAALTMAAGYIGYGSTGGFAHGRMEGPWIGLYYGTFMVAAIWVLFEPLRYWRLVRRRVALGLATPLEANRFLLWGTGSVCRFAMLVLGAVPSLLTETLSPPAWSRLTTLTLICVALAGVGVAVAYWLTFFPPDAYVRRITGNPAPAASTTP